MALAGKKRYRDEQQEEEEEVILAPPTTRARHKQRCREQTEDVLAQHFEEVQSRALAALDMVQATEQHREQAQILLEHYKRLLSQCYSHGSRRDWVVFKSSDFNNPDDVILLCHGMPLTQGQEKVFKKQVRRLNSDLTDLMGEMNNTLVCNGFVAQRLTVEEIRWALREYKKLLTGALLDFYEDISTSNYDDAPQSDLEDNLDISGDVS